MNDSITVITPTGDRYETLKFLARNLLHQTYTGKIEWIVVDDGETNAAPRALAEVGDSTLANHGITCYYIRRKPVKRDSGPVSLGKNLLKALNVVSSPNIVICEDDDWYSNTHLEDVSRRLEHADIVGTVWQKYYHLPSKSYRIFRNRGSALCSTAFGSYLMAVFKMVVEQGIHNGSKGYDARMWTVTGNDPYIQDCYEPLRDTCIGMKGLPGRGGIGVGHRPKKFLPDPNFRVLTEWMGKEFASFYIKMWERDFA